VECVTNEKSWGSLPAAEAAAVLSKRLDFLRTSRPTAVNLFNGTSRLARVVADTAAAAVSGAEVLDAYVAAAEAMLLSDVSDNLAIGRHGAAAVVADCRKPVVRMLTICNTGSLATARYGTALGVIRSLHANGQLEHTFCCETRPYNQGSRLTAFELVYEEIPATLIVDSAAAALMGDGQVDAVVAGADRVTANGDAANKIGTYSLAVLAKHHGLKFYIAAPFSTLDIGLAGGSDIEIEFRSSTEVTHEMGGATPRRIAAEGIDVWNPVVIKDPPHTAHCASLLARLLARPHEIACTHEMPCTERSVP
jgi:methylthioribose-1-phosphate isomerase